MRNLITFFATRHTLGNVLFLGLLALGVATWFSIGKEEMPEFASNWIRVSTTYPGAPANEVELYVTKPLEDELKGVVGIDEINTTSSVGSSSIRIVLDDDYPDKDEVVQEIKDAVLRADLPSEVRDLPKFRQFKSSEKAILDVGIFHTGSKALNSETRKELQKYILSFESQILSLPEVSSIDISHYKKPELQILVDPKKQQQVDISLSEIRSQILANNIRTPIGALQDKGESKVTALNELESVEALTDLILRGNYEGGGIKLGEIATVQNGFKRSTSIFKINGHEAIFLNVKKSVSTDILTAQKAVFDFIERFKINNKKAPIGIVLMDDESFAVRNRLDIISSNGILGFFLILIVLFIFLDAKTGFWVAMGIPFTMAFTLIIANMVGYTVNNMTLAGIIIVLGIVVDDAIIIAENISRHKEEGKSPVDAAIDGTCEVIKPIFASIITTCVAFTPLLFFEGFFGKLVAYIPLIVILMLLGSLIESTIILPGHLSGKTFLLDRIKKPRNDWFKGIEIWYESFLLKLFKFRVLLLAFVIFFLGASVYLFKTKMKFVMFPREESLEVFIKVKAAPNSNRLMTSKLIEPLEEYLSKDKKNVVGVRSSIGQSRRGGQVRENEASILVEVYPADEREESLNKLLKKWKGFSGKLPGLEKVRYMRGRWGHGSGNALEIQVQQNDDKKRDESVRLLEEAMKGMATLTDVEVDKPLRKKEYLFNIKQDRLIQYKVTPSNVTSVLRSFVEGSILYSINKGDEEVDVRLTVPDEEKNSLDELLNLRVENKEGQLTYLNKIVDIQEQKRPINIQRSNFKRTTMVYANMKEGVKTSPLEVAGEIETKVFPKVLSQFPTTNFEFKGEVEDSRESQGEFLNSIFIVLGLIYLILVIMFNNVFKPFLVLSIVPFGLGGVGMVLIAHGMSVYGFFAVIGALGMIGVVINDAIVMIDKIENEMRTNNDHSLKVLAKVAATRLRPVLVTTFTTVVGVLPTAYGIGGYDSMLAEMMLAMGWGLLIGTFITLMLVPSLYSLILRGQDRSQQPFES